MLFTKNRVLSELDTAEALLSSLSTELKATRVMLRAQRNQKPPFLALDDYDCHFANAFVHIERAKEAVRALHPICHQADFLKRKTEKRGRRG